MATVEGALDLAFEEAITFFLEKVNVPTKRWTDLWQQQHVRAWSVAGAQSDALLSDIRAEIEKALKNGTTLAEFKKQFAEIVKKHGWQHTGTVGNRARVIYQTNLSMAYSAGRYAQMTTPEALLAFPIWQYKHSGALHPRLLHKSWDGMCWRADDPIWLIIWPPNGWFCGCWVRPMTLRELRRTGRTKPDPTPDLSTVIKPVGSTGAMRPVTEGVDPGFAYNVGEAWLTPQKLPPEVLASIPPAPPAPGVQAMRFSSVGDADRALTKTYSAWAANLSPDESDALLNYRGPTAYPFNDTLRAGLSNPYMDREVDRLDSALRGTRLPYTLDVWRGVQSLGSLDGEVGDVVSDAGYFSTSLDLPTAQRRAGDSGTLIQLQVPAGTHAAYIEMFGGVGKESDKEYELLLPRGARFRILAREAGKMVLELLP